MFVVNRTDQYKLNSEIHGINTRENCNLYQPLSNLKCQKGTYYFGVKIFNNLLSDVKNCLTMLSILDWP